MDEIRRAYQLKKHVHIDWSLIIINGDIRQSFDSVLIADPSITDAREIRHLLSKTFGTAGEKGIGLGLPYSHDIMRSQGSDLKVDTN